MNVPCSGGCGGEADSERDWQKVIGYVKPREQGGANTVAMKRLQQEWVCPKCMRNLKKGLSATQATLV